MENNVSLVPVDKRHYRKIAQQNWGLTNEQMKGMHVHHRIPVSQGGTNDASNLYICSPSFHRWIWHVGEEWIEWAMEGSRRGLATCHERRQSDPDWADRERQRNSLHAKKSHKDHEGTPEYSERQRVKSLKTHIKKRRHWSLEDYDFVWESHLRGLTTGYQIARQRGISQWKKYANMLKYAAQGFSYIQLTRTEDYLEEIKRLESSPIAHILDRYDD